MSECNHYSVTHLISTDRLKQNVIEQCCHFGVKRYCQLLNLLVSAWFCCKGIWILIEDQGKDIRIYMTVIGISQRKPMRLWNQGKILI